MHFMFLLIYRQNKLFTNNSPQKKLKASTCDSPHFWSCSWPVTVSLWKIFPSDFSFQLRWTPVFTPRSVSFCVSWTQRKTKLHLHPAIFHQLSFQVYVTFLITDHQYCFQDTKAISCNLLNLCTSKSIFDEWTDCWMGLIEFCAE